MKRLLNFLTILLLIVIFTNEDVFAKTYNFNNDYVIKYDVVYLDMDKAFNNIKSVYGISTDSELMSILSKLMLYKKHTSGSCSGKSVNYAYRVSTNDKVKLNDKKSIYVPDIYYICDASHNKHDIDDSVTVEIEKINGKYYLPAYFFSAIPSIKVEVNDKTLYQSSNYYDSAKAIKGKSSHTVKLNINKVSNYSSLVESIGKLEYYGEKDGALWREEAKKNIEKYRRGDITVSVSDSNGNAISGADVKIELLDNSFKFGTAIANDLNFTDVNTKYFNALDSSNYFKMRVYYKKGLEDLRNQFFAGADKAKITYLRGHTLYWDILYEYTFKAIVGSKSDNDPNNITMGFVKSKYEAYKKDGNYTQEEKNNINKWLKELKNKFKNLIYDYIKMMVNKYPQFNEWDVLNEINSQEWWKYYLFYEEFLTDSNFKFTYDSNDENYNKKRKIFLDYNTKDKYTKKMQEKGFSDYIDFLVGCIETYRSVTKKPGVVNEILFSTATRLSSNTILSQCVWQFEEINKRLKAKGEPIIDAIGFQNHVRTSYHFTPNAYENMYNAILKQTGVSVGKITEYDNYVSGETVTSSEQKLRAQYLTDTVIAAYANKKINLFFIWGINSDKFSKAERDAYHKLVKDWLSYTGNFKTSSGKSSTRVYTGQYKITVTYNGQTTTKTVNVTNSSNSVEVKLPVKTSTQTNIIGDINGDGKVSVADYNSIRRHMVGTNKLTGDKLTKADVNNDGKVSIADYNSIRRIIVNK